MKAPRFGSKSYAVKALRDELRAYAKARRAYHIATPVPSRLEHDSTSKHGMFLGALCALFACGVITQARYDRWMNRCQRVTGAKVTRRPFGDLRRAA